MLGRLWNGATRRSLLALAVIPLLLAGLAFLPSVEAPAAEPVPTALPVALGLDTILSLAPTPTAVPTAVLATATAVPLQSGQRFLAYYVPYDDTSWASLQRHAGELDYVAAQWVSVDACGNVGSRDDLTVRRFAEGRGLAVLPSLLTGSGWLNHQLLTNSETSQRFLEQIVAYVEQEGYEGFDLDLEGIRDEDRDAYSAFVARLSAALHERGKLLTLAIPAKSADVRTGWAGPYDYAALGRHADLILLMTYDYHWAGGTPGSIAPVSWVDKVAAYARSQMPPEKVLLGVAFYAYDWNVSQGGKARAWTYPQAAALAEQYGVQIKFNGAEGSATFRYTARAGMPRPAVPAAPTTDGHEFKARAKAACDVKEPAAPTPATPPKPTPTPAPLQERVVWLEDAASVAAKLDIAQRHGLGGVGAWRLGQEDPASWRYIGQFRAGR
ncbi:MAG: glycosyl hydrolase family 18 protein [Chloroflexota bacterium]